MRRPCWLLLLLTFGLGFAAPAQARLKLIGLSLDPPDGNRSHITLPDVISPDNLDQMLADRLKQIQNLRESHSLAAKMLGNKKKMLEQLNLKPGELEKFRRLVQQDPELRKLIEKYRDNPGELSRLLNRSTQMSKEEMELFGRLAEKFKKQLSASPFNPSVEELWNPGTQNWPRSEIEGPGSRALPDTPTEPSTSQRWKDFWTKQLGQLADGLDQLDYADDGQALRDAIRQLNRFGLGDQDLNLARLSPGQMETVDQLARMLSPQKLGALDLGPLFQHDWKLKLPSMRSFPRVSLPSISAPSWTKPSLPSGPSFAGAASSRLWLWLALLFLAGVLVWKWNAWFKPAEDADPAGTWHLGPWPVAPDRVTTRGELVRAFEYLALLLLGPAARTQNHHEAAEEIGRHAETPAGQETVEQLARLYEQARYAPEQTDGNVPLSQDEQTFARHALCLLAGRNPA